MIGRSFDNGGNLFETLREQTVFERFDGEEEDAEVQVNEGAKKTDSTSEVQKIQLEISFKQSEQDREAEKKKVKLGIVYLALFAMLVVVLMVSVIKGGN